MNPPDPDRMLQRYVSIGGANWMDDAEKRGDQRGIQVAGKEPVQALSPDCARLPQMYQLFILARPCPEHFFS